MFTSLEYLLGATTDKNKSKLSGEGKSQFYVKKKKKNEEESKPVAINEFLIHIPLKPQPHEFTELKNIDTRIYGLRYETNVGRRNQNLNR